MAELFTKNVGRDVFLSREKTHMVKELPSGLRQLFPLPLHSNTPRSSLFTFRCLDDLSILDRTVVDIFALQERK